MSKKLKIMYFALMAVNAILCIFNVVAGEYTALIVNGLTLAWLINTYFLVNNLHQAYTHIELLSKELRESAKRESIRQQEFNKMRERAQNAEKQLQQIIDDTPARGKDGRYVKREVE
jgi:hypothetical protein